MRLKTTQCIEFFCCTYNKNKLTFYIKNRHVFLFRFIIGSVLRGIIVGFAVKYLVYKEIVKKALQAFPIRVNAIWK